MLFIFSGYDSCTVNKRGVAVRCRSRIERYIKFYFLHYSKVFIMADLLDSILGSMEKPPVIDAEKKKARGEFDSRVNVMVIAVSNFGFTQYSLILML